MLRHVRASYNPWYMMPFLLWMLAGAGLFFVFDRDAIFSVVNLHHSTFLDYFMRGVTEIGDGTGTTIILMSMMVLFKSCRNWWYVLAAAFCNIAPALMIQLIKSLVHAPRPLEYYGHGMSKLYTDAAWIHIREHWPHLFERSFPSGHSGSVFSMTCFLSMILPKGWGRAGLVLFFVALVVAYSRMYLAAHFFADIFVGSMLGAITTLFCFALMRRWSNRSFVIERRRKEQKHPPLV